MILRPVVARNFANAIILLAAAANAQSPSEQSLTALNLPKVTITARDPFVSPEVTDPYVLPGPPVPVEEKSVNQEVLDLVHNAIAQAVRKSVVFRGISSGPSSPGSSLATPNYVLIDNVTPTEPERISPLRLLAENDSFKITLTQEALTVLKDAETQTRSRGWILDLGFPLPQDTPEGTQPPVAPPSPLLPTITLKVNRIEHRSIELYHPYSKRTIEIPFERDLRLRNSQESSASAQTAPPSGTIPPEGRPPKI